MRCRLRALAGLAAVASGQQSGGRVAGLAITVVICPVGHQVTADVVHRLADGVDRSVITTAEGGRRVQAASPG